MRLLNLGGRIALERDGLAVDVQTASKGAFTANFQDALDRWDDFRCWADDLGETSGVEFDPASLSAPVGTPRQIFAIGLNYRGHAEEANLGIPDTPMVFTKFASSITGPRGEVTMPPGSVDWEAELVAIIGRTGKNVAEHEAWHYVAGLTAGQDLSERDLQVKPPAPQQFSLAKSYPGFAPIGPALVTIDEFADPGDLEIWCSVGGEKLQAARTRDMIFSVPAIVSYLSQVVTLLPGDLIFTGTPDGVGFARKPQRYLQPDDELTTYIEGIGTMRNHMRAG